MAKKRYDKEYKVQALKLIEEIGMMKAAKELGVSVSTMRGWIIAARKGKLNLEEVSYTPKGALSLEGEIAALRKQNKELSRANRRLQEGNKFLEEASFFSQRAVASEVSKNERLKFITIKTEYGKIKGNFSFYCRV